MLGAAVVVADAGGVGALTIRSLAQELGVKPMSVYHYVANKDEILDGIVDIVFSEIELPVIGGDWRVEMRGRASSYSGIGSRPLTLRDCSSQVGRTPSRANTSATSSPEVRIAEVPHTDRPTDPGHVPVSAR